MTAIAVPLSDTAVIKAAVGRTPNNPGMRNARFITRITANTINLGEVPARNA